MKIIRNIPAAFTIYSNLRYLNKYKKEIEDAKLKSDIEKEKENILLATSTWGKKLAENAGMKVTVYGRENLPTKGPIVYMANHQGYADIVALCAALDTVQFGYVAKNNLEKVPLYGKWIDRIRSVLIDRGHPREALKAISKGVSLIKEGYSLLIFPEGTRSQSSQMGEFKPGAMKLATKPKVPIIPISLDGTWKIFEEHGCLKKGEVKVMVHPAIETKDLTKEEERHLSNKVYQIIEDGVKKLRAL